MIYFLLTLLLIADGVAFCFLLRNFLSINMRLREEFSVYLAEKYNFGLVTKNQVENWDEGLFKKFCKENSRKDRLYKLILLAVLAAVFMNIFGAYFYV